MDYVTDMTSLSPHMLNLVRKIEESGLTYDTSELRLHARIFENKLAGWVSQDLLIEELIFHFYHSFPEIDFEQDYPEIDRYLHRLMYEIFCLEVHLT